MGAEMTQELELKLKAMAKAFMNREGDAIDLLNLLKTVFAMRADIQTQIVEVEKEKIVEKIVEKVIIKRVLIKPVEGKTTDTYAIGSEVLEGKSLYGITDAVERIVLMRELTKAGWNRRQAAHTLGMCYRNLLLKIKQYHLVPDGSALPEPISLVTADSLP